MHNFIFSYIILSIYLFIHNMYSIVYIQYVYIQMCVCIYIYIFNSYSLKLCHEFQNSNTITLMLTFYLCHFFINATMCICQ